MNFGQEFRIAESRFVARFWLGPDFPTGAAVDRFFPEQLKKERSWDFPPHAAFVLEFFAVLFLTLPPVLRGLALLFRDGAVDFRLFLPRVFFRQRFAVLFDEAAVLRAIDEKDIDDPVVALFGASTRSGSTPTSAT